MIELQIVVLGVVSGAVNVPDGPTYKTLRFSAISANGTAFNHNYVAQFLQAWWVWRSSVLIR
ncbi:hypothetical protein JIN85_19445 [Luteolibacter pohnpeiensis]|uniref:Uncharacterized protein n=1 Tax=Luteolibacter pohnpeiensis TaxID=454153 RepID=A0A934VXP6_9BACT|nr:hypothetical protein [Luteolibacter pohnpeiensis]